MSQLISDAEFLESCALRKNDLSFGYSQLNFDRPSTKQVFSYCKSLVWAEQSDGGCMSFGNWCIYSRLAYVEIQLTTTWPRWIGLFTEMWTDIAGSLKSYSGITRPQRYVS